MKDFIDKISSYNLFNYLFPGVLYAVLISFLTEINLIQEDFITGLFLYYFLGMIISRFGSLVIEPLLIKVGIISYEDYSDFVTASEIDNKLNLLSEVNNTYRTIVSLIVLVIASSIILWIRNYYSIGKEVLVYTLIISILFLFILSYRKQTGYISKRIKANLNKKESND